MLCGHNPQRDSQTRKDRECRLLIIGATGETQHLTEVLLGSVAKRIVRKAEIPVLVTKDESLPDYANIFSPTDFSEDSLKTAKATRKFFPNANLIFYHMIARPLSCVWGIMVLMMNKSQVLIKILKIGQKKFQKILKNFSGKSEVVLDSGILSYTRLLSVAESKNASLIALPTSGKLAFALDVLQNSNIDIFICKF